MEVIQQLLQNTQAPQIEKFQSHLTLELKAILTNLSKNSLQDISRLQLRKDNCILACYKKKAQQMGSLETDAPELLQELQECRGKCKAEGHAVRKHLDDINFYSKRKFQGCSSKCQKGWQERTDRQGTLKSKKLDLDYNSCIWDCLNRLDRRYKQYWRQQQNEIISHYL